MELAPEVLALQEMLEERIFTALHRAVDFMFRLLGLARHRCAKDYRGPLGHAAVLLVAGALVATVAYAQDKPTSGDEGHEPADRNPLVEIQRGTPDSDADTGAQAGQDDGTEDQDSETGQSSASQQADVDSDTGSPRFADLDQFVSNDDVYQSPIGALLQHNCVRMAQGEMACGLAVLEIRPGSPAAAAGLRPYSGLAHTLLGAGVVGAAMVFPPALAALGFVDQSHVGEKFDLIIGLDGQRIRSIHDFRSATFDLRGGDVIYLTLVRAGKRLQIPIRVAQQDPGH